MSGITLRYYVLTHVSHFPLKIRIYKQFDQIIMAADFNPANLPGLSFLELYNQEEPLQYIMDSMGITQV